MELEDEEDDLIIDTRGKQNPLLQVQPEKPIKEKSEKQHKKKEVEEKGERSLRMQSYYLQRELNLSG